MPHPSRRQFIKSTVAMSSVALAPNLLLGKSNGNAMEALNVASIGTQGKGRSDIAAISKGNRIAFLCDVDLRNANKTHKDFPGAVVFQDYREMFAKVADQIDVVTVSTPDHMHFPIAIEAIRHGKPVIVQKPLCNRIWEARALSNYAKQKGVLTVMGNQGATYTGTRILREWIEAGLIGDVLEVYYWTNRPIWPQGKGLKFPAEPVPKGLNWDIWQGTCATERPYSPEIHPFKWRGIWDYGAGALGDIGCHSFNSAFWALDLSGDFEVEPFQVSEFDDVTAPKKSTIFYYFPVKGKRMPVRIVWQDGVKNPQTDLDFIRPPGLPDGFNLNTQSGCGQVFVGTEAVLYVDNPYCSGVPRLYRNGKEEKPKRVKPVYPRVKGGPTQELCRAIRGQGPKPVSNFEDLAGPLTEVVLAGDLALRIGKKIKWNSAKLSVVGMPDAEKLIKRHYRKGWEPKLS